MEYLLFDFLTSLTFNLFENSKGKRLFSRSPKTSSSKSSSSKSSSSKSSSSKSSSSKSSSSKSSSLSSVFKKSKKKTKYKKKRKTSTLGVIIALIIVVIIIIAVIAIVIANKRRRERNLVEDGGEEGENNENEYENENENISGPDDIVVDNGNLLPQNQYQQNYYTPVMPSPNDTSTTGIPNLTGLTPSEYIIPGNEPLNQNNNVPNLVDLVSTNEPIDPEKITSIPQPI